MFTLAFDTTTNFCSIALFENQSLKDIFSLELNFGQSEVLIPQIQTMLEKNNLSIQKLDLLSVCTGPGSFTGVRSSVSAARAFGLSNKNLALCGVSAFEAYASNLPQSERAERIGVIIETKREDFYVAYFDRDLKKVDAPKTAFFDDIVHDLKQTSVTLTGDGVSRFLAKQTGLKIHNAFFETHPPIEQIALVAAKRFNAKTLDFPKPLYLKAADVCAK